MSFYSSHLDRIGPQPLTNKCIVLDLDECLLHTFSDNVLSRLGVFTDPKLQRLRKRCYNLKIRDAFVPKGTGRVDIVQGIKRPHLNDFLIFCFAYFKVVAVWSAGRRSYVEAIVREIFKDIQPPHVVYTWDNLRKNYGGQKYDKPLLKMIAEVPQLDRYMNLQNTFMMDDRSSSFLDNPLNGIEIPAYDPEPTLQELQADDVALLQVQQWLRQPSVAQATIFSTPLDNNQGYVPSKSTIAQINPIRLIPVV